MRFSDTEIKDLIIAWALISVAVGIALRGTQGVTLPTLIWISAVTVGFGFVAHELAHKFTAQHFRKFAEFRANIPMLVLALIISFSGIVFAAPGAVIISGFVNRKENGIIAAAGPIANIVLALLLLPLFLLLSGLSTTLQFILGFGLFVNSLLALFNLIPFWMFDGAKIITWNKGMYAILVTTGLLLVFISTLLVPVF